MDGLYGPEIEAAIKAAPADAVLALENTRFDSGEAANDETFSVGLAALRDVFVDDALERPIEAHVSTTGVAEHVAAAGPRLVAESRHSTLLTDLPRPFTVVLGGAKTQTSSGDRGTPPEVA